jgi:hypothetical protein
MDLLAFQNSSDLQNRDAGHIAAIWPRSDPAKMGCYQMIKMVQFIVRYLLSLLLLSGCMASTPWQIDHVASNEVARIRYCQPHNPLVFELVKMGTETQTFLSLSRFSFSGETVKVSLVIEDQTLEEELQPHQGGMRLALSETLAQSLIMALQEGKKVRILVDDFEEELDPAYFARSYNQIQGQGFFWQNIVKGPL